MHILSIPLAVLVSTAAAAQPQTPLTRALDEALRSFPARTAIYVKHLKTGEEAAVRADDAFNSQSVIKIPIMVRAFQLAEQGTLKLDERVTLTRAMLRDGSGILQYADLGLQPTLSDLIQQMIITSDNTATDEMTTRVGGVEALNTWLAASGYRLRMVNRGWGDPRGQLPERHDASDFETDLHVRGEVLHHRYRVLRMESSSVPSALAALLLWIRDTTHRRPHIYFEWTEGSPVANIVRYLIFGQGEVAPVTREILRQAEPDRGPPSRARRLILAEW